ncbi:hypothetical protein A8C75_13560 [Marinobacterium aestuarii]|uniref:Carboxyvinyl-carboxyphosphonate phosphorylmutase n=1 Tax=Marinobacterium aestuarii TaxID=1821621 RepID=A0A1A9EZ70_9GAMM|nr:isocitrate lyase/PEP mutase family protein [Marinobacterium aestuarii]ANG63394.1 hypothetical protein A8C75_13560 [Marinobacterium aestuarii]
MRDERFRGILEASGLERLGSVYSPLTARMARDVGFEYGIVGGSIAAMALLGVPDISLISSTELVDFVRRITQSTSLAIIVDGDGGYGNPLNAMRLVADLEQAGAHAVTLEDTVFPVPQKKCTGPLVDPAQHAVKLKSAVQARKSLSFGIIARTSVLKNESIESVLDRISLYASTGVDAICLTQVEDINLLKRVSSSTDLPLMLINHNNEDLMSPAELNENRVRLYLSGHQSFEASLVASYLSYLSQRDNTSLSRVLGAKEIASIYNNETLYANLIEEFM